MKSGLYQPVFLAERAISIRGYSLKEIVVALNAGQVENVLPELRELESRIGEESEEVQRLWLQAMIAAGAVSDDVAYVLSLLV